MLRTNKRNPRFRIIKKIIFFLLFSKSKCEFYFYSLNRLRMVGIFAFSHLKLFVFASADTRNRKEWHVNKTGRKLIKISTCQKKKRKKQSSKINEYMENRTQKIPFIDSKKKKKKKEIIKRWRRKEIRKRARQEEELHVIATALEANQTWAQISKIKRAGRMAAVC